MSQTSSFCRCHNDKAPSSLNEPPQLKTNGSFSLQDNDKNSYFSVEGVTLNVRDLCFRLSSVLFCTDCLKEAMRYFKMNSIFSGNALPQTEGGNQ